MPNNHDLTHDRYVRSNNFDPTWVIENHMGPNALWLTEALTSVLSIEPGMRVLDLGCGRAMSSIFIAKEFGATVWAADLWISASANLERIAAAGLEGQVIPVDAEAHALPFAKGYFDVIVSMDAFHYFGTADLYLGYITEYLKPGGRLGAVMPALVDELGVVVPESLAPYWEWDFCAWHSPEWWRHHWAKTGLVSVDDASWIDNGWEDWLRFNDATTPTAEGWMVEAARNTRNMLEADRGQNLGFTRVVATKHGTEQREARAVL